MKLPLSEKNDIKSYSMPTPGSADIGVLPAGAEASEKPGWVMDDVTPTSLFTGIDSELGSIAPR